MFAMLLMIVSGPGAFLFFFFWLLPPARPACWTRAGCGSGAYLVCDGARLHNRWPVILDKGPTRVSLSAICERDAHASAANCQS